MENFKIDLFEKETGELFPSFQKLNQTDCNICYQHFRKNIKVYDLHESVFDNFQSNGSFIEKYNALDDHFSLLELFADLNLCCDVICINWDEFKTIDVFRIITAKPKAHAFKNEMCFPLTKTKCELKKHPNSKFECFFNDFNRTKTSLFLPFPSKLIQDNLVCVLELQE